MTNREIAIIEDGASLATVAADGIANPIRRVGADKIDLVYNRTTDFDFSDPHHAVLRNTYRTDGAVVTPNPWSYARFADKRNLILLSDANRLAEIGAMREDIDTLCHAIPRTVAVSVGNAEALWKKRNALFYLYIHDGI